MENALQGKFCDCCGRRCPLSNPGCGIGEDEAQRVLAGEAPAAEQSSEGQRHEHRSHHGRHGHHGHHHAAPRGRAGHGSHGRGAPQGGGQPLSEDERLSRVLHHCAHMLVHRERHQGGQAGMLAILASHGEMSQARLADKLGVRSASASELLSKMEAEGLVCRAPDEEDGRAYKVALTEEGRAAAQEVQAERRARDAHLFEALIEDEKEQLTQLLDKLAHSWH